MARKTGLALGGGGARGLAHIGILKVLEREKIKVDCISGTSMGAIIGACYSITPDIGAVERAISQVMKSPLFAKIKLNVFKHGEDNKKRTFFSKAQDFIKNGYLHLVEETQYSLLGLDTLEGIINALLPDIDVSDTRLPFACVATDLTNGAEKIFTTGPLRRCVLASASIPGVFPPIKINDVYYNDGGAVSTTPVAAVKKLGANFIIGCDVKSKIIKWNNPEKAKEIISRSDYITGVLLHELQLKCADVVISPQVRHLHWTEFDKMAFISAEGEKAAQARVHLIHSKLTIKGFTGMLRGWWEKLKKFKM